MRRFLLSLFAFVALAAPALAEPRIALVIGNSNYGGDLPKLPNPANDAELMASTLKKLGFKVVETRDADLNQMNRSIREFSNMLSSAGSQAVGLFFYAGHGLQIDGENWLIPIKANIQKSADAEFEAVPASKILGQMQFAENSLNIVILDACRNNPLARDFRSIAASQGFAEIRSKPKGTFISYSTAPGEVAVDGSGGHSPFAEALAAAMQLPGLDLPEVFQRVRERVLAATGERQTPWDSSSLVKSFYFVPPTEEPAKGALVADAAPASMPTAESALRQAEAKTADAGEPSALTPIAALASAAPEAKDTEATKAEPVFVTMTRSLYAKPGSRLRAEPSTAASVVAKLPANAEIRAVARSKDGSWYEVATKQGKTAYIHADAVTAFRAAKAKKAAAPSQVATFAPQPVAPAPVAGSKTGIGVVDQALNWLQANSGNGRPAPETVRASR